MSRFVSGGTDEEPTQRDEAWLKAQQELDAAHLARQDAGKQEGGKSLYETLQANKAAKQEAFEESTRLRNQFRSLDEDEIEFLDSVQESSRAKEAAVRHDTKQHLDEFRRQQEAAERAAKELDELDGAAAAGMASAAAGGESWAAGPRKRKKGKDKDVLGVVKIRRTSSGEKAKAEEGTSTPEARKSEGDGSAETETKKAPKEPVAQKPSASASPPPPPPPPAAPVGLGLGAYSSDEE